MLMGATAPALFLVMISVINRLYPKPRRFGGLSSLIAVAGLLWMHDGNAELSPVPQALSPGISSE
jgi:hypothetical protein